MTGLLLDTHVVMWWVLADSRITVPWLEAITASENSVSVSAATVWEVEIKKRNGKLSFDHDVIEIARGYDFDLLPIAPEDARLAGSLDWEHRDPFDRMLAAQATNRALTLITADGALLRAPGVRFL